jgi:hypothetical protein
MKDAETFQVTTPTEHEVGMSETHDTRRIPQSIRAILAGFFAVLVLSLVTDKILHSLNIYPPWGQPMREPGLNLLALSYRIVYSILGSYIAARLAPRNPMRHALVLGFIGLPLSVAGAIAGIKLDMGPAWYPIALVLTTLPCAWLGGVLYRAMSVELATDATR